MTTITRQDLQKAKQLLKDYNSLNTRLQPTINRIRRRRSRLEYLRARVPRYFSKRWG